MFQYFNIQFEPYQKRSYHTNLDCLPWLEILLLSWNMCEDNSHCSLKLETLQDKITEEHIISPHTRDSVILKFYLFTHN